MRVIVDANIVFSAILNSNGKIGDLLINSRRSLNFIAPDFLRTEIRKHHPRLVKISKMTLEQVRESEFKVCNGITFPVLSTIQKVFLYLMLVLIGLYAGMLFFHEMAPVETQLNPIEYAKYWKIVDGTFMHTRMGIMGPGMMIMFIITILLFIKDWKSLTFLFLVLSFIAFALDIHLTVTQHLPINAFINELDLENMTELQTKQLTVYQSTSISNFETRFVYGIISFVLLCLTPFFLPRLIRQNK